VPRLSDDERYLSLATFRRSGDEIRTPVWFAVAPGTGGRSLWVYTNAKSGKVKRIRREPRARIAACDVRGRVHGEWLAARARLIEGDAAQAPAFEALLAKYGWQMRALRLAAQLGGRWRDRTIVAVDLDAP
jgi:PPOX class probable F420-dependent enzyme